MIHNSLSVDRDGDVVMVQWSEEYVPDVSGGNTESLLRRILVDSHTLSHGLSEEYGVKFDSELADEIMTRIKYLVEDGLDPVLQDCIDRFMEPVMNTSFQDKIKSVPLSEFDAYCEALPEGEVKEALSRFNADQIRKMLPADWQ
jgi:hypothetical protein